LKIFVRNICFLICIALTCTFSNAASYAQRLERIFQDYQALGKPKDIQRLVELDAELKKLEREVQDKGIIPEFFKKKHKLIGVEGDHQSDQMVYSGKLLVEAHKINPNSALRSYTFFSTIQQNYWEIPDLKQAKKYLLEFPNGPFAADAHKILGTFYYDLTFLLAQYTEAPSIDKDDRDKCFAPYIDKTAYEKQLVRSKQKANHHLNIAYQIKKNPNIKLVLLGLKRMKSDLVHWCVD
jgi:hypothetical protein